LTGKGIRGILPLDLEPVLVAESISSPLLSCEQQ
jgi:hypothetical protein